MAMRSVTLRFSEALWSIIRTESELEGVSASQYIREAALARAVYAHARREPIEDYDRIVAELRELLGG